MSLSNIFVHHVFFWLKNPGSREDRAALVAGLEKLSKAGTIRQFHIGQPADTARDVIETSYAVSWLLIFDTAADQEGYQVDPIHLQFVKECSPLWNKVVVYDSVDASV
jgi:hypothetical protein